jgi:hypothetical protein
MQLLLEGIQADLEQRKQLLNAAMRTFKDEGDKPRTMVAHVCFWLRKVDKAT